MSEPILDSLKAFFVMIFGYEIGTTEFYISMGSTLVAILVVARLFAGLFGSSKGIFSAVTAALLPLLLGVIGYVLVELYALPKIEAAWAATYLPWTVFGVVTLLVVLLLSTKVWDLGAGVALVAFVLAGLAGFAAQYTAELVIEVIDASRSQVEKRDENLGVEIEKTN